MLILANLLHGKLAIPVSGCFAWAFPLFLYSPKNQQGDFWGTQRSTFLLFSLLSPIVDPETSLEWNMYSRVPQEACDFPDNATPLSFQLQVAEDFFKSHIFFILWKNDQFQQSFRSKLKGKIS